MLPRVPHKSRTKLKFEHFLGVTVKLNRGILSNVQQNRVDILSCEDAALEVPFELVTQRKLTMQRNVTVINLSVCLSAVNLKIDHCDRTMINITIIRFHKVPQASRRF